jgi:membrane protein implicated in regulation of membrane protease activity
MALIDFVLAYGAWSWLVFGLVLLGLELVLPGGVFVWLGIAAIITAVLGFVFPLDWAREFAAFGILGLVSILFWLKLVRSRGEEETDRPLLNRRAERQVGEEMVLAEPITDGYGRVPIGDTLWRVAGPDLPAGRRVRVVGYDGPVLRVEESE